jgi:hypothetical protein
MVSQSAETSWTQPPAASAVFDQYLVGVAYVVRRYAQLLHQIHGHVLLDADIPLRVTISSLAAATAQKTAWSGQTHAAH